MDIKRDHFVGESYFCRECNKSLLDQDVNRNNWRCDECGKKILIDIGIKNNSSLVRLFPYEMDKYDLVYDAWEEKLNNLKSVISEGGKYKIGIAGYRTLTFEEGQLINCLWNDQ